jgi:uncharacterized protein (TIGR00251 family)
VVSFPFIRESAEGVYVAIKLQPRSSRNKIGASAGNELKVYVTAPPADSEANKALIRLMAEALDCPKSAVHLVKGQTSRSKTLFVQGMLSKRFMEIITPLLE